MADTQKQEQSRPPEKTNKPGAIIGGAILGASLGSIPGAFVGGILGGVLSVLFEDESTPSDQNGGQ